MDFKQLIEMIFGVLGGLGLFLLGMKQMSEGMQAIAGEKLRTLIGKVTNNRYVACGVGALVTGLIQSSSVTSVMVIGMVNAGLMTLRQSIGVIMGADIGTTITAWLIALKIADYGLPILGLSALVFLFAKNDRIRYSAMMLLGLGMVFFGLEIMKMTIQPLRSNAAFIGLLAQFEPNTYWGVMKCVGVGALVTAVIQSSSATVGITIALAATGTISFETSIALVLGENIGTTITAFLASLGMSATAKRTAYSHILIKIIGVSIVIPFFFQYLKLLHIIMPDSLPIATRIATAHSLFNIMMVSVLILLIKYIAQIILFIFPEKEKKEKPHLTSLNASFYDAPAFAVQQSYNQILRMGYGNQKMMTQLREFLESDSDIKKLHKKIIKREIAFDIIQKEIVEFISALLGGTLSHNLTTEARNQLRMADEYESVSDYIVVILKLSYKMKKEPVTFSSSGKKEILLLHDKLADYSQRVIEAVDNRDAMILSKVSPLGIEITGLLKSFKCSHLKRVSDEKISPFKTLIFMDMLNAYRRLLDHEFNIAEAIAGEK